MYFSINYPRRSCRAPARGGGSSHPPTASRIMHGMAAMASSLSGKMLEDALEGARLAWEAAARDQWAAVAGSRPFPRVPPLPPLPRFSFQHNTKRRMKWSTQERPPDLTDAHLLRPHSSFAPHVPQQQSTQRNCTSSRRRAFPPQTPSPSQTTWGT